MPFRLDRTESLTLDQHESLALDLTSSIVIDTGATPSPSVTLTLGRYMNPTWLGVQGSDGAYLTPNGGYFLNGSAA